MNRSELAALLAANPPVPSSSSNLILHDQMLIPVTSSPSSPKVTFQYRVKSLQEQPSPSRYDLGTRRRPRSELQHVSTLRVTQKRRLSADLASQETPNFWAEEQEAWSHRSPKSPRSHQTSTTARAKPALPPFHAPIQPNCQLQESVHTRGPLRTFEPQLTGSDTDERPKTSRGPQKLEMLREENEEDKQREVEQELKEGEEGKISRQSTSSNPTVRNSKFIEGSMNDRSFGIASSWFQDGPINDDKPLPPPPPTKHVAFSCTPVRELPAEKLTELPTTRKKERSGLRKSISHFNFQTFSDKMKFFGGSGNEAMIDKEDKTGCQRPFTDVDMLNERKRKAHEAYAAQFGFKKQKLFSQPDYAAPSPNVGGYQPHGRNVEPISNSFRSSERSAGTVFPSPAVPRKKSRRDLERENAELRARLAQQQDHQPSVTVEKSVRGKVVTLPPGKRRGKLGEDVPPVPQIPGRGVLKVLENSKNNPSVPCIEGNSDASSLNETKQTVGARQHWEWPEDVF